MALGPHYAVRLTTTTTLVLLRRAVIGFYEHFARCPTLNPDFSPPSDL
jgi:hypothetical protein